MNIMKKSLMIFSIGFIGLIVISCGNGNENYGNNENWCAENNNNGTTTKLTDTPWKDKDTYELDPKWTNNQILTGNSPSKYAGVYAYENLSIGDNVHIYSSGISQLVIKVKGTLTLGKNAIIQVRNGYYKEAPVTDISTLTSKTLFLNAELYRNIYLLPSTYGIGGDGGNGQPGKSGQAQNIYLGYSTWYLVKGVGGSGGGGGGGGFGGGLAGYGGAAGNGPGGSGHAGSSGKPNGGDGGYGGANVSIGIGGGATGIGTHGVMPSDKIGAGGGGGGGNGGNGASGGSSDLYYGGGAGFGGFGGGAGGYGGGVLYITAQKIVFDSINPPHFVVSGQVGGYSTYQNGKAGKGGLIIIYSNTTNLKSSLWTLTTALTSIAEKDGHGLVFGGPLAVFINNVKQ